MYLWWRLCTLYLHSAACQVRGTVGGSGLCSCACVTYFEPIASLVFVLVLRIWSINQLPCVLSLHDWALWAPLCLRFLLFTNWQTVRDFLKTQVSVGTQQAASVLITRLHTLSTKSGFSFSPFSVVKPKHEQLKKHVSYSVPALGLYCDLCNPNARVGLLLLLLLCQNYLASPIW